MRNSSLASSRRRGSILIAATWIIIVLAAVALVMAQRVRVELITSGNQLSQIQADAIEHGAEQFVLSQVDGSKGDALTVESVATEALQVGDGYFWIIRPNPDDPQSYAYGIVDEAGKINLNSATTETLQKLPSLSTDTQLAASIIAWRGPLAATSLTPVAGANTTSTSEDENYYLSLPQPYHAKNNPFESVDELLLVRGFDSTILYGYDTNHNATLDTAELNAGGMATQINAAQDTGLGIAPYVTVWTVEPSTSTSGSARLNINDPNSANRLRTLLQNNNVQPQRVTNIMAMLPNNRPFRNIFDFYAKTGLTVTEFTPLADQITTDNNPNHIGRVNINTASATVLSALPGLDASDAQSLISQRQTTSDTTSLAWIVSALTPAKATSIGDLITTRSYQFSADIVAVSGDGRAFRRVRLIVDAQNSPPKVLYRKDLTNLGWPLDPAIRQSLRSGQGLPGTTPVLKGGV